MPKILDDDKRISSNNLLGAPALKAHSQHDRRDCSLASSRRQE